MKLALLLGLVALGLAHADQPLGSPEATVDETRILCGAKGICVDSTYVGDGKGQLEIECRKFCSDTPECLWYTFKPSDNICLAFKDCNRLDDTACPDCLSGEKACKIPNCRQQKCCTGLNIGDPTTQTSPGACLDLCKNTQNCLYFNYDIGTGLCVLLENVPDIAAECTEGQCVSGDADCPLPKCKVDACCSADPSAFFKVDTAVQCLQACVAAQPTCTWYTFLNNDKFCFLLPDCNSLILEGTGTCESGEVDCPQA